MPINTYKRRLNTANALVCLLNVTILAVFWVLDDKEDLEAARIITDVTQLSMVISCSVLVWAIVRLVRLKKSRSEKMVNKIMITIHIVAYLFIIISSALTIWVPTNDLREFKIS